MNIEDVREKLKQIEMEDYIWIIYIGIIFFSWYSNDLEKKYFIFNDIQSRKKYRDILIFIFTILVIIYLYFFYSSYDDLEKSKGKVDDETYNLLTLSMIGSLLILISGIIFLYIAIKDEDINVEIAFN